MFCSNCGAQLPEGSIFCAECGTRLTLPETETVKVEPQVENVLGVAPVISQPIELSVATPESEDPFSNIASVLPEAAPVAEEIPVAAEAPAAYEEPIAAEVSAAETPAEETVQPVPVLMPGAPILEPVAEVPAAPAAPTVAEVPASCAVEMPAAPVSPVVVPVVPVVPVPAAPGAIAPAAPGAIAPASPEAPAAPATVAPSSKKDNTKAVSVGAFFGLEILFFIPVIGFIASIIFAVASRNKNIRHYAVAKLIRTLVFLIILTALAIAVFIVFQQSGATLSDIWDKILDIADMIVG